MHDTQPTVPGEPLGEPVPVGDIDPLPRDNATEKYNLGGDDGDHE
tara:strand:- start:3 stop:137 length:135 start_codon:yes stop_codon:yes gene_type:complete